MASEIEQTEVLIIIPAYNEQDCIENTVQNVKDYGYDYVVINDGSIDETQSVLNRAKANNIQLISNLGIGGAVQTGYIYALRHGYKVAVQFDGDGQHDARYISRIIEPIIDGSADMVIGSRFVGNESEFKSSSMRRLGIKTLSTALKLSTGITVRDVTSGFRAIGETGIRMFADYYPTDYPEPESLAILAAHNLTIREVPVAMHERQGGQSSISGIKTVWYMFKVALSIFLRGVYKKRGTR